MRQFIIFCSPGFSLIIQVCVLILETFNNLLIFLFMIVLQSNYFQMFHELQMLYESHKLHVS
jgi:hypothetical protein